MASNTRKKAPRASVEAEARRWSRRRPRRRKIPQPERTLERQGSHEIAEGHAHALGATILENGINFAVVSGHAQDMFVLLFDRADGPPTDVIRLPGRTGPVRHGFVRGLEAGQLYGFKARGEFDPEAGLRCNENKLLLDPYARAYAGSVRNEGNLTFAYDLHSEVKDLSVDSRDSAPAMPKCIATRDAFDWEDDRPPGHALSELIVYEVHAKGFTAHPTSGVRHPGTFLGFIEKIPHLQRLGVNAVELLPVHAKFHSNNLLEKGLRNYWGYDTLGFFAPEPEYGTSRAPGCEVEEFKLLVKALHKAGIEVILDVVYNHTAEGNELGPTLCFKGLDNPAYYSLTGDAKQPARYYRNFSGTGNTLNFGSPAVVRLAMDSLRYWVQEMHVDGFRFDLAGCLGRTDGSNFHARAPFFQAVFQDPVLARVKLIAEPWDCAGYFLGAFPAPWAEWNGKFRDNARKFIKGDPGQLQELGWRITGSADLFAANDRGAEASVNFVACHDGFTLRDLVSYDGKHNEANGEDNRDGENENNSWNHGFEGETEDPEIRALRLRQVRNFACLLFFSQGVPMIQAGDEGFRTQGGNSNTYCQDNATSWLDWDVLEENGELMDFFAKAIALRKKIPLLMGRRFLTGVDADAHRVPNIAWYGADGGPVAWEDPEERRLAFHLDGFDYGWEPGTGPGKGRRFYFILNAGAEAAEFVLPDLPPRSAWLRVADTALPGGRDFLDPGREEPVEGKAYRAPDRSVAILVDKVAEPGA